MQFSVLYTKAKSAQWLARARKFVEQVNALEETFQALSDEQLKERFIQLRGRNDAKSQPVAFALVREAAKRTLGMRHFDVQLMGGFILGKRMLAEMKTGEGKTLTITAPAAFLALAGKGVHVVTANSYLAKRDAELMRPVYEFLGLTVGAIDTGMTVQDKQAAYACDITYGVGSEFGFDYLKDHLVPEASLQVQRGQYAAIVDEVDSILIDEARIPLVISDAVSGDEEVTRLMDACVRHLTPGEHFVQEQKDRTASLTEAGYAAVEQALIHAGALSRPEELYAPGKLFWVRRLHSAVKAYALFRKDRDYVVEGGKIVLVDIGSGRKMGDRRLEDGLHEALEAREGLSIQAPTVVKATITYQNYFGQYQVLAGLTGTAVTEAEEFSELYQLQTVVIPTNRPSQRQHGEDLVYLTKAAKFSAVISEAAQRSKAGQPVLIGCSSIRDAEVLDRLLTQKGLAHETLTAKHIEHEARIIAQAGRPGSITVATNMAGRGTDVLLGGEKPKAADYSDPELFDKALVEWNAAREQAVAAGGLCVLGTERDGIRRVDNQLAGRSGRQGDPGFVQFFLSLEDDLLKVFGASAQLKTARRMVEQAGGALAGSVVSRLVTLSQRNAENMGFSARKSLMQYDNVLADQRRAVYSLRNELLRTDGREHLSACLESALEQWLGENLPGDPSVEIDSASLKKGLAEEFGINAPVLKWVHSEELDAATIRARVKELFVAASEKVLDELPDCSRLCLEVLDEAWSEHLSALDELRQSVSLKKHTGLNPVYQYNKDAFELFKSFEVEICRSLARAVLRPGQLQARADRVEQRQQQMSAESRVALELEKRWVTRNEACPCGSGKRFRLCHGAL